MLYFHLSIVPVAPFLLWDCMQKRPKRLHHMQQIRLHHYDILLPRYDHRVGYSFNFLDCFGVQVYYYRHGIACRIRVIAI